VKRALIAALIALAGPVLAQSVKVESGRIEGITLRSGVRAWLGIPFAEPPLRALRWKPPRMPQRWANVFHADRFAPECLQPLRNRSMNHYFGNEATSEDCLYLNIWAPRAPAPKGHPYPVLVWVYGGGFTIGSASMANYSGAYTAQHDVIQVNIAYRLGALGFLAHPELTKEGGGASGNYGLMDQIAALQWVQRNISAFGGDPARVTIAGQSAGSMSVALLQSSPRAKGLFRGVVGMSGSPFGELLGAIPLAQAEADGVRLQNQVGAHTIDEMRDLSADRIVNAPFARQSPITIDQRVLPATPGALFAARKASDVPAMVGYTSDEGFMSLGTVNSVADYQAAVHRAFAENAAAVLAAYPAVDGAEASTQARAIARDATLGRMTRGWAQAQALNGTSPTYVWMFTRRQPYTAGVRFSDHDPATAGAYHTGDVPYWLGTLDAYNSFRQTRDWSAADRKLAGEMSARLIAFVKSGVPKPDWPRFDAAHPQMMQLGLELKPIDWINYQKLDVLAGAQAQPSAPSAPKPRD